MARWAVGVFLILHGLVHLLYFGQARRLFEVQAGLTWPDRSWALSRLLGEGGTRWLAAGLCAVAALAFVAGGLGLFLGQGWWQPVAAGAAVLSAVTFPLCWNGSWEQLSAQGSIAILINLAILVAVGLGWGGLVLD